MNGERNEVVPLELGVSIRLTSTLRGPQQSLVADIEGRRSKRKGLRKGAAAYLPISTAGYVIEKFRCKKDKQSRGDCGSAGQKIF